MASKKPPNLVKEKMPTIFIDSIVDVVTEEEHDVEEYGNAIAEMFNSAPSVPLAKKRGPSTHVVHTKMGYDVYFHLVYKA